ncbi:hypothetical protein FGG08_001787 [Glutinoglossum americanum]|uniref:NB-ARC domain-containing protein n=1 Tax=Glutinoglossum americanum TaxID=1670608 RepID=A0A9P8IAS9_9PEZI|nr:hypothetical protein FGG08_001787 [Glutinoglossum americanum]
MAMDQNAHQQHEGGVAQGSPTFGSVHAYNSKVTQIGNIYARTVKLDANTLNNAGAALEEGFSNVTLQLVSSFVERPALHAALKSQLHDPLQEPARRSRVVVVQGLGGAGKTQLILNYIEEFRSDYFGVFWIDAEQRLSVEREFAQIYRLLFLSPVSAEQNLPCMGDIILRVKNRFSQGPQRWLWVFDSADSIEDPKDPNFLDITTFIPSAPSVHVLVTTRSSTAPRMTSLKAVEVREMEQGEALDLFWNCSGLVQAEATSEHLKAAESIVKELGCLALAINLAGSYISATPRVSSNLALYLLEYRERRRFLLAQKPNKLVHQYGESVLTTWETSFEAMRCRSSLACNLLALLAFLDPEDIYLDLFNMALNWDSRQGGEEVDLLGEWWGMISPGVPLNTYDIEAAFAVLESFSLVRRGQIQCSYSMHKLVHAWGYDRLDLAEQLAFGISAIFFLGAAITYCTPEPTGKLRLVRHLMANFTVASSMLFEGLEDEIYLIFLRQLQQSARFLDSIGRWTEEGYIETFGLKQCVRILGEEHPETISVMSNLAKTLGHQGKLEEAASMKKEVLEKRKRILGEEHPDTISAVGNLAVTLGAQGKLEEAVSMINKVLEKRKRILGEEHPETISAMGRLASMLGRQGKLEEAASMKKEVLEKRKRILGEEHHGTISALGNLANTLGAQGKLEEAVPMMKEVLEKRKRILGEEHPDTVTARHSLMILNLMNARGQENKVVLWCSIKI